MFPRSASVHEMLSPLVSWILSASSSSSSSLSSDGEGLESSTANNNEVNNVNNVDIVQNDVNAGDIDIDKPSTSSAGDSIPSATALPGASTPSVTVAFTNIEDPNTMAIDISRPQKRRVSWVNVNDPRRQSQRLWRKEDEVKLLESYLDYRDANPHEGLRKPTMASFYSDVKPKLNGEFNMNQLVEKLRRLKRKFGLMLERIRSGERPRSFRCPNEEAIFEISNKLWGDRLSPLNAASNEEEGGDEDGDGDGNGNHEMVRPMKRQRLMGEDEMRNLDGGLVLNGDKDENRIKGLVEETMKTRLSPLLRGLMNETLEELGIGLNPFNPSISSSSNEQSNQDDKWRKQRILELEIYSKKLQVVQDHIKAALIELKSIES